VAEGMTAAPLARTMPTVGRRKSVWTPRVDARRSRAESRGRSVRRTRLPSVKFRAGRWASSRRTVTWDDVPPPGIRAKGVPDEEADREHLSDA
jgi:hypothetical protein